jgi:hypothetical protein
LPHPIEPVTPSIKGKTPHFSARHTVKAREAEDFGIDACPNRVGAEGNEYRIELLKKNRELRSIYNLDCRTHFVKPAEAKNIRKRHRPRSRREQDAGGLETAGAYFAAVERPLPRSIGGCIGF